METNTLVAQNLPTVVEALYKEYYHLVLRTCQYYTRDEAEAEEAAQEVFIKVIRRLDTLRNSSAIATWLHSVARNQVRMGWRQGYYRREVIAGNGCLPDTGYSNPIIDHIALASAIKKLAPGYRKVFLLHDVEGYEHNEIAGILGITDGSSKSQLHKARMKLRQLLLDGD